MTTDELARLKAAIAKLPPGPYELEGPMEPETWIVQAGQQPYEWRPIATVPTPDPEDGWSLTQTQANAAALVGLLNHAADLLALAESHERLLAACLKCDGAWLTRCYAAGIVAIQDAIEAAPKGDQP